MLQSKINNRYSAQTSAQFGDYKLAEEKLINYIESKPSNLNLHLAYNDLILYSYRQFQEDSNAVDRCLDYCKHHIKIIPKLIKEFSKYQYNFEFEYIMSVEVGILILNYKKDLEGIMEFCGELAEYYSDKSKQNYIANVVYKATHIGFDNNIDLIEDIDSIFYQYSKFMKKKEKQEKIRNEELNKIKEEEQKFFKLFNKEK